MSEGRRDDAMTRVETGSRLHFGLLRPPAAAAATGGRAFGGCGLMVESPAVRVGVEPAANWAAHGPSAERALAFARRYVQSLPAAEQVAHRVIVEACPPEHRGLGTGTQLALAVASALARSLSRPEESAVDLARRVGRGARSALGVHGFARGGFLVDGGKRDPESVAPLVARMDFPPEWRIVLFTPPVAAPWHGERERAAFAALSGAPADDALCRLALLGMLPALAEHDLAAFGEALYEFNRRAGEPFQQVQGGPYASREVEGLIGWLRGQGARGVGQSSWGPTVFAIVGDADMAAALSRQARTRWGPDLRSVVTAARNRGMGIPEPDASATV